MSVLNWVLPFFRTGGASARKQLERVKMRVFELLEDLDGDGIPDRLAELVNRVAVAVDIIERLYPSSAGVKRGAEKLAEFRAGLEVSAEKWSLVTQLIDVVLSARRLKT